MAKIGVLDQKPKFLAPKKNSLLEAHHVLATTGKSCANKKVTFSQRNIGLLADFGCFFGEKNGLLVKKDTFRPNEKSGRLSVIPAGTIVIVGHFFYYPDDPTKFC